MINDLVDAAQVEESFENEVLYETLNKNKEDEPTGSINKTELNKALKESQKNSEEFNLIKDTIVLLNTQTKNKKEIKELKDSLIDKVYIKLENLSNEEIDQLMFKKWFGTIIGNVNKLIEGPVINEINKLRLLKERYKDTLTDIDNDLLNIEEKFNNLLKDLVNTNE